MESAVTHTYTCSKPEELAAIASEILSEASGRRIFTLKGPLGAGKTTLVQYLCKSLGISDNVSSPTFTIMNEYLTGTADPVYHFDLYRIESENELFDFGYEVYFYSGNYCFIEWPEKAKNLIPATSAVIEIKPEADKRIITLSL